MCQTPRSPRNELVVYDPVAPILRALLFAIKRKALRDRLDIEARIERMEVVYGAVIAAFPELTTKIKDARRRLQLRTRGIMATEDIDAPDAGGVEAWSKTSEAWAAHLFMCKKAYRAAVPHAHPDLGGDNAEFTLITAAYRAHDLGTLQEYVLSRNWSVLQRIAHWQTESKKPAVAWVRYQASEEFKVVRLQMSGQPVKAREHAHALLNMLYNSLEAELLHYIPFHSFPVTI